MGFVQEIKAVYTYSDKKEDLFLNKIFPIILIKYINLELNGDPTISKELPMMKY